MSLEVSMLQIVGCWKFMGERSFLSAGQEDSLAPAPQPVSEVAAGLLQFAEFLTASTAGTFNLNQAAGWTDNTNVFS